MARRRRTDQPGARSITSTQARRRRTTSASSSATATTTRTTARAPCRRARFSCRRPNATPAIGLSIFPAGLPRRPRADVQLARRARDDSGRRPETRTCRASSSASGRTSRRIRRPAASGRSTTSAVRSRSTSAASTRTRAARSSSTSSSATRSEPTSRLSLVLVGHSLLPDSRASAHPPSRLPGRRRQVRRDGRRGPAASCRRYFESLSMVALEAWALGKPVLANAQCDVLKGQCIRSNAGLYYERYAEFVETLHAIEHNRWLSAALGRNGRQYFQNNYDWPVIERKYLDMLAQLQANAGPTHAWSRCRAGCRRRARRPRGGRRTCLDRPAGRVRSGAGGARSAHPPGARDARLRRRDRPRGARHPARAARGRLRVGHLRRDRRPPSRSR